MSNEFFRLRIQHNRCPRPHWGAYSAPHPSSWFQGAALRQEGNGGEGSEGIGEGEWVREKKGGIGKGIAPWLLGIDAPVNHVPHVTSSAVSQKFNVDNNRLKPFLASAANER